MDPRVVTVLVIVLVVPVILGIDYCLLRWGKNRATISRTLLDFALIPVWGPLTVLAFGLGFGIALGHLFVPQHVYVFLPVPVPMR